MFSDLMVELSKMFTDHFVMKNPQHNLILGFQKMILKTKVYYEKMAQFPNLSIFPASS